MQDSMTTSLFTQCQCLSGWFARDGESDYPFVRRVPLLCPTWQPVTACAVVPITDFIKRKPIGPKIGVGRLTRQRNVFRLAVSDRCGRGARLRLLPKFLFAITRRRRLDGSEPVEFVVASLFSFFFETRSFHLNEGKIAITSPSPFKCQVCIFTIENVPYPWRGHADVHFHTSKSNSLPFVLIAFWQTLDFHLV